MAYQMVGSDDFMGMDLSSILTGALMFALGLWIYYRFFADETVTA